MSAWAPKMSESVAAFAAGLGFAPPVALFACFAHLLDRMGGGKGRATAHRAVGPQSCGGLLIPVDDLVEFELVDLAGFELSEPFSDVSEENAELLPVVCADEFERGSALCFDVGVGLMCVGHRSTVAPDACAMSRAKGGGFTEALSTGSRPPAGTRSGNRRLRTRDASVAVR